MGGKDAQRRGTAGTGQRGRRDILWIGTEMAPRRGHTGKGIRAHKVNKKVQKRHKGQIKAAKGAKAIESHKMGTKWHKSHLKAEDRSPIGPVLSIRHICF